jgi:Icc-related predicted phosphoesterase
MILLYASDLHGQIGHYDALRKAVAAHRTDVLVLGGDLFPDDPPEFPAEMGRRQAVWVLEVFRGWLSSLLKECGDLTVLSIFGNRDWYSSAEALEELARQMPRLRPLKPDTAVELNGLSFVGYSNTPPTTCYAKDFERLDLAGDVPPAMGGARWNPRTRRVAATSSKVLYTQFPSMSEDLEKLARPNGPWVFVAHAPPYETVLDRDHRKETRGSKAVRHAIERYQPLLSLHGHVHESPEVTGQFQERIGRTTAVNVGQQVEGLCYGIIEIDVAGGSVVSVERKRPQ